MDLAGNVREWCLDAWREDEDESWREDDDGEEDPCHHGAEDAPRVVRGGSWIDGAGSLRCAGRGTGLLELRDDGLGFRVVCVSPPEHA